MIAKPGSRDQCIDLLRFKVGIKRFKPPGGGVLGQPGDIHQQGIEGGTAQQKTADGQVGDRLGVAGAAGHSEGDAPAMVTIEPLHQLCRGIREGSRHQDVDPLNLSLSGPGQPEAEQQGEAEQSGQRAPADGHATTA